MFMGVLPREWMEMTAAEIWRVLQQAQNTRAVAGGWESDTARPACARRHKLENLPDCITSSQPEMERLPQVIAEARARRRVQA